MRDLLYFDSMITPRLITLFYWIALVLLGLGGLGWLFFGHGPFGIRLFGFLIGVPLYALLIRVWCEVVIVLFKIHGNIQRLADRG